MWSLRHSWTRMAALKRLWLQALFPQSMRWSKFSGFVLMALRNCVCYHNPKFVFYRTPRNHQWSGLHSRSCCWTCWLIAWCFLPETCPVLERHKENYEVNCEKDEEKSLTEGAVGYWLINHVVESQRLSKLNNLACQESREAGVGPEINENK